MVSGPRRDNGVPIDSDERYLLKVLGLSAIPRVVTFVLTLFSFSIMLRAVGAAEYGIFVYLGAIIGIFESVADFGVSAAVGKAVAEVRMREPGNLNREVARWIRLQTVVALAGLLPFAVLGYTVVAGSERIAVGAALFVVVALTSWVAIAANFIRSCLRSTLAFRSLAVLDTTESVIRSAGYLAAAWLVPTALGLAVAGLATVIVAVAVAAALLHRVLRRQSSAMEAATVATSYRAMLSESISFLGLRVTGRLFQALPLVILGRQLGADVVGLVGAFARIAEFASFPFAVIGNALAVRAQEMKARGHGEIVALWDAALRFILLSLVLTAASFLGSDLLAHLLVPGSGIAGAIFAILSVTVVTSAAASIITPMSDYIGALHRRIALVAVCALLQVPFIWGAARLFGVFGGVTAFVVAPLLMNVGYFQIAKAAFFERRRYSPPVEVPAGVALITVSVILALSIGAEAIWPEATGTIAGGDALSRVAVFSVVVIAGVWLVPSLRGSFLTLSLFDFTRGRT